MTDKEREEQLRYELDLKDFYGWVHTHRDMYSKDEEGYIMLSDNAPERMKRIAEERNAGWREHNARMKILKESGITEFGGIKICYGDENTKNEKCDKEDYIDEIAELLK